MLLCRRGLDLVAGPPLGIFFRLVIFFFSASLALSSSLSTLSDSIDTSGSSNCSSSFGQHVLLHSNVRKPRLWSKLRQHFNGPYQGQNCLNDSTYALAQVQSGSTTLANVQRIIRYYSTSTQLPPSTAIEVLPSGSTPSTFVHPSTEASLQLLPSVMTSLSLIPILLLLGSRINVETRHRTSLPEFFAA